MVTRKKIWRKKASKKTCIEMTLSFAKGTPPTDFLKFPSTFTMEITSVWVDAFKSLGSRYNLQGKFLDMKDKQNAQKSKVFMGFLEDTIWKWYSTLKKKKEMSFFVCMLLDILINHNMKTSNLCFSARFFQNVNFRVSLTMELSLDK